MTTDHEYIVNYQYKTDANLAARQSIYRFQQPRIDLHARVLELAGLRGDEAVLDIGCGNGAYLAALNRLGHAGPIVGFDLSPGMLAAAQPIAGDAQLGIADAEQVPVATNTIDVGLAMHMLYHVPDRAQAIRELRRVTKSDGVVLVVTNTERHLREVNDVVLAAAGRPLPSSRLKFRMETGEPELRAAFADVERHDFESELHVTDPQAVVDYVASMQHFVTTGDNERLLDEIRASVSATIARRRVSRAHRSWLLRMPVDTRTELLTLFDFVWRRFRDRMHGVGDDEWRWTPVADEQVSIRWRFEHLHWLLSDERNTTWLGFPAQEHEGRIGDAAASDLVALDAAYAHWRALLDRMAEDSLGSPMGDVAGQWGASTRREFVLHIADELVHHTAECALLRDLYAGR